MDKFQSLEEIADYLKKNYNNKMVLEDMPEFDRVKMIGEQTLANLLLRKLGEDN